MFKWRNKDQCAECANKDKLIERLHGVIDHLMEDQEALKKSHDAEIKLQRPKMLLLKEKVSFAEERIRKLQTALFRANKKVSDFEKRRERYEAKKKGDLPVQFFDEIAYSDLPIRVKNVLRGNDMHIYYDLKEVTRQEILRYPNFGPKSLKPLLHHIEQKFPNHQDKFQLMRNR